MLRTVVGGAVEHVVESALAVIGRNQVLQLAVGLRGPPGLGAVAHLLAVVGDVLAGPIRLRRLAQQLDGQHLLASGLDGAVDDAEDVRGELALCAIASAKSLVQLGLRKLARDADRASHHGIDLGEQFIRRQRIVQAHLQVQEL